MREDEALERALLMAHTPELFAAGSLLYIGARPDRAYHAEALCAAGRRITLLEVWPKNAAHFESAGYPFERVVTADVRQWQSHTCYDVAVWFSGPEHVAAAELPSTIARLETIASLVVLLAPWGKYPQGEYDGNPYEAHKTAIYPEMFAMLGYETATAGVVNDPLGMVLGWK